jgi:transposase
MSKRPSVDLRQQAVAALESGMKRSEVCRAFGIHRTTLYAWHQRSQQGSLEDRPVSGRPRQIKSPDEAALVQQLQATPDATLEEHVARWKEEQGRCVSRATMARDLAPGATRMDA